MRDEGAAVVDDGQVPSNSVTRGFFFSDLRGYTEFVEAHGAAAAAELLGRYRTLMRSAIRRYGGAEIKTEGDSFYVVFNSVTTAVPLRVGGDHSGPRCLLRAGFRGRSTSGSASTRAKPSRPTTGTSARRSTSPPGCCSKAGAGEVLVSETVRALTRTLLPVEFQPRGRVETSADGGKGDWVITKQQDFGPAS